jgi:hypothetical protein
VIAVIAAALAASLAAVLLVIVTACIHLQERRARIRQRPTGRLTATVRRVIGPYIPDAPAQTTAEPANAKKEAQV